MEVFLFREAMPSFSLQHATEYLTSFTAGSYGCISLYHQNGTQLSVMVNGRQTYPHYFPSDDHPGWQVVGEDDSDWDTEVDFLAENREPTPTPIPLVIPVERTLEILTHFWNYGRRTAAERWTSLVDGEP